MKGSLPKVSFGILDFNKPVESKAALESIKENAKFPYEIIYLSNGGIQEYVLDFYRQGLIDKLILNKKNVGCGYGTETLYSACETEYMIYFQSDQILAQRFYQSDLDVLIGLIEKFNYVGAIGLAGYPCGRDIFSERGNLMRVDFYNSIPKTHGGPGPFNHLKYNEQCVQEYFKDKGLIMTCPAQYIADRGIYTVRELPCGGVVRQRTDTKQVWWDKLPKQSYMFPEMDSSEWDASIQGLWKGGDTPKIYIEKGESFRCWDEIIDRS